MQTVLFLIGGVGYTLIEFLWRGYSHWSMFVLGGICFVFLAKIAQKRGEKFPLWRCCLYGALGITALEFVTGCIVNLLLGWNVWDYSDEPFQLLGQICLPFTSLWFLLCIPTVCFAEKLCRIWIKRAGKKG